MSKAKKELINTLQKENIKKEIIKAFEKIDQRKFLDSIFKKNFYSDKQINIGYGEVCDPTLIIAKMINHLSPQKHQKILEIGTGSGYSTAILSTLVKEVVTIEYHEELALSAKEKFRHIGINNINSFSGDAKNIESITDKFDGIVIFAACSQRPLFLIRFLVKKGLMVFPMGLIHKQQIVVLKNEPQGDDERILRTNFYEFCNFTPIRYTDD